MRPLNICFSFLYLKKLKYNLHMIRCIYLIKQSVLGVLTHFIHPCGHYQKQNRNISISLGNVLVVPPSSQFLPIPTPWQASGITF